MHSVRHALVVPTLSNHLGFTELLASVDVSVRPFVSRNYDEPHRSVAASWNWGIRAAIDAGCDVIHVVNDDVTYLPGCMQKLAQEILFEKALLVSGIDHERDRDPAPGRFPHATYACFAVGRDFFDVTDGGFDEGFTPAYFEDMDMLRRLTLLAPKHPDRRLDYMVAGAHYHHVGSATQNADPHFPVVARDQFESNRHLYVMKWGGVPGQERYDVAYNRRLHHATSHVRRAAARARALPYRDARVLAERSPQRGRRK